MAFIFLVEDDYRIRALLVQGLAERGHAVRAESRPSTPSGRSSTGIRMVVVLDLGLPDLDGAEALKMLRAVSAVPVVVATARDDEAEIVHLFDSGADDYVVKPFSVDHLEARIRALLRRSGTSAPDPAVEIGDLRIDAVRREATLAGERLDL